MRAILLLSLLLAIALPASVSADDCAPGDSTPGTLDAPGSHGEVGVTVAGVYAFKDHAPQNVIVDGETITLAEDVGNWVYQEQNGLSGLQRADWWVDDTCGGAIQGDFWVW